MWHAFRRLAFEENSGRFGGREGAQLRDPQNLVKFPPSSFQVLAKRTLQTCEVFVKSDMHSLCGVQVPRRKHSSPFRQGLLGDVDI